MSDDFETFRMMVFRVSTYYMVPVDTVMTWPLEVVRFMSAYAQRQDGERGGNAKSE